MRTKLIPLALIAAVGLGGAAFAATNTAGTIKAIDSKAMTITLEDGKVFQLPMGFKLESLKVGEKVSINWDEKDGKSVATEVKAAG